MTQGRETTSGSLGGPDIETTLNSPFLEPGGVVQPSSSVTGLVEDQSFIGLEAPGAISTLGGGVRIYTTKKGDTFSGIAQDFGISVNTIRWANNGVFSLKPGLELLILPVSGVLHTVQNNETLSSIAASYHVDLNRVQEANQTLVRSDSDLRPGELLIIPGGVPPKVPASRVLVSLDSFFGIPAAGFNWGQLHYNNAVDIANVCGTPIYAMAEGLVSEVLSPTSWNGGYGGLVGIEHQNKITTRYAHTSKNVVQAGDYVPKGALIAYMGNTGNVTGKTGCHVHVEVLGAKNPLAK